MNQSFADWAQTYDVAQEHRAQMALQILLRLIAAQPTSLPQYLATRSYEIADAMIAQGQPKARGQ